MGRDVYSLIIHVLEARPRLGSSPGVFPELIEITPERRSEVLMSTFSSSGATRGGRIGGGAAPSSAFCGWSCRGGAWGALFTYIAKSKVNTK